MWAIIAMRGVERWKTLKKFPEVHDLPVTCIAARPFPVPLRSDEDGIQMHALSASADSRLACLSLEKRRPARKSSSMSFKSMMDSILRFVVIGWILYPIANEVWDKCEDEYLNNGLAEAWECVRNDVLIAPASRPGIMVPPY